MMADVLIAPMFDYTSGSAGCRQHGRNSRCIIGLTVIQAVTLVSGAHAGDILRDFVADYA